MLKIKLAFEILLATAVLSACNGKPFQVLDDPKASKGKILAKATPTPTPVANPDDQNPPQDNQTQNPPPPGGGVKPETPAPGAGGGMVLTPQPPKAGAPATPPAVPKPDVAPGAGGATPAAPAPATPPAPGAPAPAAPTPAAPATPEVKPGAPAAPTPGAPEVKPDAPAPAAPAKPETPAPAPAPATPEVKPETKPTPPAPAASGAAPDAKPEAKPTPPAKAASGPDGAASGAAATPEKKGTPVPPAKGASSPDAAASGAAPDAKTEAKPTPPAKTASGPDGAASGAAATPEKKGTPVPPAKTASAADPAASGAAKSDDKTAVVSGTYSKESFITDSKGAKKSVAGKACSILKSSLGEEILLDVVVENEQISRFILTKADYDKYFFQDSYNPSTSPMATAVNKESARYTRYTIDTKAPENNSSKVNIDRQIDYVKDKKAVTDEASIKKYTSEAEVAKQFDKINVVIDHLTFQFNKKSAMSTTYIHQKKVAGPKAASSPDATYADVVDENVVCVPSEAAP